MVSPFESPFINDFEPEYGFTAPRIAFLTQLHKALSNWRQGDSDASLANLEALLRTSQCHPFSTLLIKIISASCLRKTINVSEAIIEEAHNPSFEAKVRVLHKKFLEPLKAIHLHDNIDPVVQDNIGSLCQYRRWGVVDDVDYPKNGTGLDWLIACNSAVLKVMNISSLREAATEAERQKIEKDIANPEENPLSLIQKDGGFIHNIRRDWQIVALARVWMTTHPVLGDQPLHIAETYERLEQLANLPVGATFMIYNGPYGSRSHLKACIGPRDGKAACGFHGAASEVEWKYFGHKDNGWHFEFTRRFPIDLPFDQPEETQTTKKEIVYKGGVLALFEDEHQWIGIEPADAVGNSGPQSANEEWQRSESSSQRNAD